MIHTYESKPAGFLSTRLIDKPNHHKMGDIVKVRRDDGSFDQYIVAETTGCLDCVCFETDRCPVYKTLSGDNNCILCYGYPTKKPIEMAFRSIDSIMENI